MVAGKTVNIAFHLRFVNIAYKTSLAFSYLSLSFALQSVVRKNSRHSKIQKVAKSLPSSKQSNVYPILQEQIVAGSWCRSGGDQDQVDQQWQYFEGRNRPSSGAKNVISLISRLVYDQLRIWKADDRKPFLFLSRLFSTFNPDCWNKTERRHQTKKLDLNRFSSVFFVGLFDSLSRQITNQSDGLLKPGSKHVVFDLCCGVAILSIVKDILETLELFD